MQRIIKNNQIVDETWHLLPKETTLDELSNCDDYIVPLQRWRDHAHVLKARAGGLGGWTATRKRKRSARTCSTSRSSP